MTISSAFAIQVFAMTGRLRERLLSFWNPEAIELEVLRTQERQKLAPVRNVCKDMGI